MRKLRKIGGAGCDFCVSEAGAQRRRAGSARPGNHRLTVADGCSVTALRPAGAGPASSSPDLCHASAELSSLPSAAPPLNHPKLESLYRLWRKHCRDDDLPAAADFDPTALRPWAGNLVILDVGDAANFVYAYYGDAFAAAFGADQVGRSTAALPPPQRDVLTEEYARARERAAPLSRVYTADFGGGLASWERLVLPLAGDGHAVDKLMVAAFELPTAPPAAA